MTIPSITTQTGPAGHVCQNLYLACEAVNAGTCAMIKLGTDA